MRLIVDEDLPRSLFRDLLAAGFDTVDVRDVGLRGQSDEAVFDYAVRERRAVLTADVGFGNVLRFPLGKHAGIIVARFSNNISSQQLSDAIVKALALLAEDDVFGNVIIVTSGNIRIRRADG